MRCTHCAFGTRAMTAFATGGRARRASRTASGATARSSSFSSASSSAAADSGPTRTTSRASTSKSGGRSCSSRRIVPVFTRWRRSWSTRSCSSPASRPPCASNCRDLPALHHVLQRVLRGGAERLELDRELHHVIGGDVDPARLRGRRGAGLARPASRASASNSPRAASAASPQSLTSWRTLSRSAASALYARFAHPCSECFAIFESRSSIDSDMVLLGRRHRAREVEHRVRRERLRRVEHQLLLLRPVGVDLQDPLQRLRREAR